MTDLTKALLWRHNDAVKLQSLIANKQAFYDKQVTSFFSDWKKDVFDLETANDFGLMVWSIILDFPISINSTESAPDNSSFGFGAFRKNFGHQFSPPADTLSLTTDIARIVLKLRFYGLVTRATIPECTAIVKEVFKSYGDCYCLDGLNMTIRYIFNFNLPSGLRQIFNDYDLLPRPNSVEAIYIDAPNSRFGFGENRKNFGGTFR